MRVLVMGGTQFNGRALVHELVRAGHDEAATSIWLSRPRHGAP